MLIEQGLYVLIVNCSYIGEATLDKQKELTGDISALGIGYLSGHTYLLKWVPGLESTSALLELLLSHISDISYSASQVQQTHIIAIKYIIIETCRYRCGRARMLVVFTSTYVNHVYHH